LVIPTYSPIWPHIYVAIGRICGDFLLKELLLAFCTSEGAFSILKIAFCISEVPFSTLKIPFCIPEGA
jgi:hypothetical protein